MTREDIIAMAKKAGFVWLGEYHSNLEDFAKLVAQYERKACAKRLDAVGCEHCSEVIREMGQA
jgi:hypothetical protein